MNVNTRDLGFIKFNGEEMNWVEFNGNIVYETWKELIASGVPPLSIYSSGNDLLNYKMYGNSKQDGTPTPENPIEVESVGVKTINLYDSETYPLTNNRYISYANGNYVSSSTNKHKATDKYIPIKPNTTYSINYASDGESPGIAWYDKNYVYLGGVKDNVNFTTSESAKYLRFTVGMDVDVNTIQLNEGATILPFEPFGYRIPVKVSNNLYNKRLYPLINNRYITHTNGVIAGSSSNKYKATDKAIPIKPNTTYSINYTVGGNEPGIAFYDENNNYVGGVKNGIGFTTPSNAKYLRFTVPMDADDDTVQLNEGSTILELETITTNIYLREALLKYGDYVDYIDFENKKVVRNITKTPLSDFTWTIHASYSYIYSTYDNRLKGGINPLCDILDSTTYQPNVSIRNMTKDYCIKMNVSSPAAYISDSIHTTNEEFREFIKNSDSYIVYIMPSPTEETIELPNIKTLKGTITIETDTNIQPSNMEIVYKGK